MNNQRTISALLDLINRLEYDLEMVGQENIALKAETERAHEARKAAQEAIYRIRGYDMYGKNIKRSAQRYAKGV